MQTYQITAQRISSHESVARAKQGEILLDTDLVGREDAFNPVELLLSALAACMLKGIERMIPLLSFQLDGAWVQLTATRQDAPPKLVSISYEITIDSHETDARLELLHRNILKYGTISNSLGSAVSIAGTLQRQVNDQFGKLAPTVGIEPTTN
jgi:uncharacterized OsmC-like protein